MDEPLWGKGISREKSLLALSLDEECQTGMDHGRSEQGDGGMMVMKVIPVEELETKQAGIGERAKPVGKVRAIFESLEVGLGKGIVV